jgi:hypothetical protein
LQGFCFVNNPAPPRCDFSGGCAAGLSCTVGAGGPKFGDYNGIACSNDSAFVAWAAATAPTGLPAVGGLNIFFAHVDVLPLFVSVCGRRPELCNYNPRLDSDKITIRCDRPDCRVIVPVPDICTKVLNCPGCGPGQLCTPEYSLSFEGLQSAWQVELVRPDGSGAPATIARRGAQTVVQFKPPKTDRLGVRGAKYFLLFRLARNGKVGADYPLTVKMSARMQ